MITSPAPEAQRKTQKTEAAQELILAIGNSIVLRDVECHIRTDLVQRSLPVEGDTVNVLIQYLAAPKILVEFEQIQNFIFGSQIFLLKKLNEVAGQGQPREFIETHFQHVKELFQNELGNWSFDQYLAFLISRALIVVNNNTYHIMNLGVEYLTWIARNGRSENRPL